MSKVQSQQGENNPLTSTQANQPVIIAGRDELNSIGGINSLVKSIKEAITEFELKGNPNYNEIRKLNWLREKLIKTNFDKKTVGLMSLLLSDNQKPNNPGKTYGTLNNQNYKKYLKDFREEKSENVDFSKFVGSKSIDLNQIFAHQKGVAQIIKSLTVTIEVLENEHEDEKDLCLDVFLLKNLRDTLIMEYYGEEAFNLFEAVTL